MSITRAVLENLRDLPVEKQRQVLDFVVALRRETPPAHPRRMVRGLWADLVAQVTEQDIAQARQEMWQGFPREDPR
jgi:hypothetical protein